MSIVELPSAGSADPEQETTMQTIGSRPIAPQPHSALLKLPGEIRNRIYHYIFNQIEDIVTYGIADTIREDGREHIDSEGVVWISDLHSRYVMEEYPITTIHETLGIIKACRQLHRETTTLPFKYAESVVLVTAEDMVAFLSCATPAHRALIKRMEIERELPTDEIGGFLKTRSDGSGLDSAWIMKEFPGLERVMLVGCYATKYASYDIWNPPKKE